MGFKNCQRFCVCLKFWGYINDQHLQVSWVKVFWVLLKMERLLQLGLHSVYFNTPKTFELYRLLRFFPVYCDLIAGCHFELVCNLTVSNNILEVVIIELILIILSMSIIDFNFYLGRRRFLLIFSFDYISGGPWRMGCNHRASSFNLYVLLDL
jgi:hypothetical protein